MAKQTARAKAASEKRISKAMNHQNVLGAGAKARKGLNKEETVHAVMREYKHETLHSGSGRVVTKRSQAIAIGLSEAGKKSSSKSRKMR